VVVAVLIAVFALTGNGMSSSGTVAGPASPSAPIPSATAQNVPTTAAASAPTTTADAPTSPSVVPLGTCPTASSVTGEHVGYVACGSTAKDVGVPAYDSAQAHRKYTATLKTNQGTIVFTAAGANAPYTVFNFVYLAQKQYFDGTRCHRLTTQGIYVLQCGDPTGTGTGGPGYEFQDENLDAFGSAPSGGSVTYPAGTVAMANAGPGTNGSQFFLVYRASDLSPLYTPFGTITQGLNILSSIAAQGTDNSSSAGDGSPVAPVTLEQVTVSAS
jgi:peptidyl-prolyl cis-trans isomerase B (cyclophilin B)